MEPFLPARMFDAHTHLYDLHRHRLAEEDPGLPEMNPFIRQVPLLDREVLKTVYSLLFPGREIHGLFFGWVFQKVDFARINQFVAEQAAQDPLSVALMLTPPDLSPDDLAEQVDLYGFRGLKPYYSWTEKTWDAGITDIIPERLLEVANDRELIITLHLGKRMGIADEQNVEDLVRLSGKYPGIRWILAHCARSSVAWPLQRAIDHIKDLPNLWYDTSSVTDSEVFSLMFKKVPLDRIMFGNDIPSDLDRGQMVGWGFAWALLTEEVIAKMNIPHCDSRATFVLYESLRALRRAVLQESLGPAQIQDIFYNNAVSLLGLPSN